jgi:hypothetical protein
VSHCTTDAQPEGFTHRNGSREHSGKLRILLLYQPVSLILKAGMWIALSIKDRYFEIELTVCLPDQQVTQPKPEGDY